MSKPLGIRVAHPEWNPLCVDEERDTWRENRKMVLEAHGHDIALAVALRPLRRARTHWQILFAVEEVLVRHVGVEAFVVLDAPDATAAPNCARSFRAMSDRQLRALLDAAPGCGPKVIALYPLGVGSLTLGSVAICRLMPDKEQLDAFDHALLQALGAQTALALRVCEDLALRPTSRPPRGA